MSFAPCLLFRPPLRAGGGPTLFSNGTEFKITRRFGRWKSSNFHIYSYGILNIRYLRAALGIEGNLTNQIRATDDLRLGQERANLRQVGRGGKFNHRVWGFSRVRSFGQTAGPYSEPNRRALGPLIRRLPFRSDSVLFRWTPSSPGGCPFRPIIDRKCGP